MFLAIAVDNLANAQVLTHDEEEELKEAEEQKKIRNILYSPTGTPNGNALVNPQCAGRSKWTKVRAMPKMLLFARSQKEKEENPFKGVIFQGRTRNFVRYALYMRQGGIGHGAPRHPPLGPGL